jgi:hypothetical protein
MKRQVIPNGEKESTTKRNTRSKEKKPYHSPRLIVYGNLSQLTGAKGGGKADGGGAPRTRV